MAHTTRPFQVPLLLFIMVFLVLGVWSVWAQDGLLQESGSTARSALSEIQQLADSTGGSGDRFGWSISLDDDTLFVGSPYIGSRGSVFIFERDPDGTWNEREVLSGDGIRPDDAFGISLALERDTAVIGAPGHDTAYIFTRDVDGGWSQSQRLTLAESTAKAEFGTHVDLSGDRIIVAAPRMNTAYVYQQDSAQVWRHEASLVIDSTITDVAIEGDRLLIGAAKGSRNVGAAYLYELDAGTWLAVKKLTGDGLTDDNFGVRVALQGSEAFVSAYSETLMDNNTGAVYIFSEKGGSWLQVQKITAHNATSGEYFGVGLAVDGETMAVGSFDDSRAYGSVYRFRWSGTDWIREDKTPAVGGELGYTIAFQDGELISGVPDANSFKGRVYVYAAPDAITNALVRMTNQASPVTR